MYGHTSGEGACARGRDRAGRRALLLRCVIEASVEEDLDEELPGGQSFDDAHRATTAWAGPGARPCRHRGRLDRQGRRLDGEGLATVGQVVSAAARGQEAEVADADKALRQHVQEKAPQEFVRLKRQRADLAPVAIVLPPKR